MGRDDRAVKKRRTYNAARRRARAGDRHGATLEVARGMFLDAGYAATTVEGVAEAAGVSAATIYKSYGGKAGLIRELCRRALEGAGQVPAEERSDALRALSDLREVVAGWSRLMVEVAPRISPLLLVLRDAGTIDPEAARLYDEFEEMRLARMTDNARFLRRSGHLRGGVTVATVAETMWFLTSPETYDLLVRRRRWSVAKLSRFMASTLTQVLV